MSLSVPGRIQSLFIDMETPLSCTGSGPLYNVDFVANPTGVVIGDFVYFDHRNVSNAHLSYYVYQVTGISGSTYTLKYIQDTGSLGLVSPCTLCDGTNDGYGACNGKAPAHFHREVSPFIPFVY